MSTDVLDDYLEELLLDIAAPAEAAPCAEGTANVTDCASSVAGPGPVAGEPVAAAAPSPAEPVLEAPA
ncbi:hypothetical protein, partial [Stenotrophomonas sp. YIM B06876]|uniref:hypothetical protein n=1 Tax=Stenotrophomonas sp. YIM B06876 TaxID=3060211 RepID=UPI0027396D23